MKRLVSVPVGIMTVLLVSATLVQAHCEVPCGIYDDQRRFEQMLEDQTAIAKAMTEINKLAGKDDALSRNQLVRWVNTKESHAENIQHIVSQYFLAQRIKPGKDDAGQKAYVRNLIAAHAVIQKAMKCKQTVDPANADLLKKAILDLHKAYEK
jgi:nickel superoxide dismutase